MLKKITALLLGLLLACSFALADSADSVSSGENYMVPRQFMDMFNSVLKVSAEKVRATWGDEETDRILDTFTLSQYEINEEEHKVLLGSDDWEIEVNFVYAEGEEPSLDAPAFRWYLCLEDEAGENAARITMYTLNLMIGYTHKDTLGSEAVQHYFETFTLGEALKLPDGYELVILRPDGADYAVFAMNPSAE